LSERLPVTGFWRVGKRVNPELRHSVLTLVAFSDLHRTLAASGGDWDRGIEAFLAQNDGKGWLIPETLRLADYGLGHDDRAQRSEAVASLVCSHPSDRRRARSADQGPPQCYLTLHNLVGDAGRLDLIASTLVSASASALDKVIAESPTVAATTQSSTSPSSRQPSLFPERHS
jgi:hypothetical protein